MSGSSSGRGQALLSRCTARHTYMHKCRQGAGETVPKHYTVLHTSYHSSMQTNPLDWKFTKSMASLHARTQFRPFGHTHNCVDSREFTWGSLKIHNLTVSGRQCTDCRTRSILRSILVHIRHPGGDRKEKSVICEVPCKDCGQYHINETS